MSDFDLETPVGDIVERLPAAVGLFNRHGISFCCGGGHPLSVAAANSGLDPAWLLAAIREIEQASGARVLPDTTPELIEHILWRYHEVHRSDLEWLLQMAQKVEAVHGNHDEAPLGLTDALTALAEELDSHMQKEEQVLFPMMREGGHPQIGSPIAVMLRDHDAALDLLAEVRRVTRDFTLPVGACRSWTALYTGLTKFADDLAEHIAVENLVLFPRFLPA